MVFWRCLRSTCELNLVADLDPAFFDSTAMGGQLRRRMLGIDDFNDIAARGRDHAAVADLPAGFAVKRRLGGEQLDLFAFDRFDLAAGVAEDGDDRRFAVEPIVAGETDLAIELDLGFHADSFARLTAAGPLRFHELLETLLVDVDIVAAQNVFGEIEGKAVGVVEAKGDIAGQGPFFSALSFAVASSRRTRPLSRVSPKRSSSLRITSRMRCSSCRNSG